MIAYVAPIQYDVILGDSNDPDDMGKINYKTGVINIYDNKMIIQATRQTICHEIGHAMLRPITNNSDEAHADALGNALMLFLQDSRNKQIIEFIIGDEDEVRSREGKDV